MEEPEIPRPGMNIQTTKILVSHVKVFSLMLLIYLIKLTNQSF